MNIALTTHCRIISFVAFAYCLCI